MTEEEVQLIYDHVSDAKICALLEKKLHIGKIDSSQDINRQFITILKGLNESLRETIVLRHGLNKYGIPMKWSDVLKYVNEDIDPRWVFTLFQIKDHENKFWRKVRINLNKTPSEFELECFELGKLIKNRSCK